MQSHQPSVLPLTVRFNAKDMRALRVRNARMSEILEWLGF